MLSPYVLIEYLRLYRRGETQCERKGKQWASCFGGHNIVLVFRLPAKRSAARLLHDPRPQAALVTQDHQPPWTVDFKSCLLGKCPSCLQHSSWTAAAPRPVTYRVAPGSGKQARHAALASAGQGQPAGAARGKFDAF